MCTKWLLLKTLVAIYALAQTLLQASSSTASDSFYSAGVVAFHPSTALNSEARLLDNLNGYLAVLDSEEAKNLDIIVFPEATLNDNEQATFVPNPAKDSTAPCGSQHTDYHRLLVQLSCAAKRLAVYLVINLTEKEWCGMVPADTRPCASSGLNLYNTNVVFDRKGAVISRYRKVHLYGENKNTTFVPEISWFDTDFGVRFGQFICFDILFYAPAQQLVLHNDIKDFIYPCMWFSQLPFLTALQVQQGWSYANNVNLLAACSSDPLKGSSGTGVYHGRQGIVVAKMDEGDIGERKLYAAQVPKYRVLTKRSLYEPSSTNQNMVTAPKINFKSDNLQSYETVSLNLTSNSKLQQKICFSNSSFCCEFDLKWQPLKLRGGNRHYHYRVGVYDGWRNEMAAETNQLKNCALFSCVGESIMDCGKVTDTDIEVVFENITISATFPKAERFLIMPNSLNASIMPLPVNHFQWQETVNKNNLRVRFELNTTTANVMAFSIYGNYYDCIVGTTSEKDDLTSDTTASTSLSKSLAVFISLINMIF